MKAPLKTLYRLRQHKDEAVRLLLSAYLHRDPREKIVDPYNSFAFDYDLDKVDDSGSATLWKTSNSRLTIAPELYDRIVKDNSVALDDVFEQLAKHGFFCCDVVTCRPGGMSELIYYVLGTKSVGSFYRKNDSAIGVFVENIFRSKGYEVAQKYGKSYRFNDCYPVVGPKSEDIDVKGVFSLRIDVGVGKSWHSYKQAETCKSLVEQLLLPNPESAAV